MLFSGRCLVFGCLEPQGSVCLGMPQARRKQDIMSYGQNLLIQTNPSSRANFLLEHKDRLVRFCSALCGECQKLCIVASLWTLLNIA